MSLKSKCYSISGECNLFVGCCIASNQPPYTMITSIYFTSCCSSSNIWLLSKIQKYLMSIMYFMLFKLHCFFLCACSWSYLMQHQQTIWLLSLTWMKGLSYNTWRRDTTATKSMCVGLHICTSQLGTPHLSQAWCMREQVMTHISLTKRQLRYYSGTAIKQYRGLYHFIILTCSSS